MRSTNETNFNSNLLTIDNPVFCCYAFWSSILIMKMLLMSILASMQRFRTKTFANVEDLVFSRGVEVQFNNPDVERVRRAHRNDLENILPFLIIALSYLALKPNPSLACWLLRIGSLTRILHTLVYAFRPIPQPTRSIAFNCHFFITFYMAFYVLTCTIWCI